MTIRRACHRLRLRKPRVAALHAHPDEIKHADVAARTRRNEALVPPHQSFRWRTPRVAGGIRWLSDKAAPAFERGARYCRPACREQLWQRVKFLRVQHRSNCKAVHDGMKTSMNGDTPSWPASKRSKLIRPRWWQSAVPPPRLASPKTSRTFAERQFVVPHSTLALMAGESAWQKLCT